MSTPKINLKNLAYVHYAHQDLLLEEKFLLDFGLEEVHRTDERIYFRGTGAQSFVYIAERSQDAANGQRFIAGAWVVNSAEDLQRASQMPGASNVEECNDPGLGSMVTLKDPCGFEIRLHHGQAMLPEKIESISLINLPSQKPRKGEFVRVPQRPSRVHKLGHYGFMLPAQDFQDTLQWYTSTFNLKVTDSVYSSKSGQDTTCFMHIDKGDTYTDHHSFFLGSTSQPNAHVHHASYEVQNLDDQLRGHDWLKRKGWKSCWGVGRHVLGSQIFDYWFDAMGNILEHYIDGDLVNGDTPHHREVESPQSLYIWGPNVPLGFVTGNMEDADTPLPAPA